MKRIRFGSIAAMVAIAAACGADAYGQHSTGPKEGQNTTGTFEDVKSPPMKESQIGDTTWMIHINGDPSTGGVAGVTNGMTNYAGFLFDLQYDGGETSFVGLSPAGPHTHIEPPLGVAKLEVEFQGSQDRWHVVEPLALWIAPDQAKGSGITLDNSQVTALMHLRFHAKNTTTANNSDIDIRISQLGIIRHNTEQGVTVRLQASDWIYLTTQDGGAFAEWGQGNWVHVQDTQAFSVPPSGFYATGQSKGRATGYGIEHVPEPASFGLLIAGAVAVGIGRMRKRV